MTTAAAHLFEGAVSGTADRCRLRWGLREGAVAGTPMEARPWRLFGRPARATDAGKVRRHLPAVLSPAEIPRRPTKEVVWPKRHGPTRICSTWHRGRHILLRDAELSRRGPMPGGASGCRTGWNSAAVGLRAISERCVRGG